jgi:uncharacterized membrane protein
MARSLDDIVKPTRRFIARIEVPHFGNDNGHNGRNNGADRGATALVGRAARSVGEAGGSIRGAAGAARTRATSIRRRPATPSATEGGLRSRIDRRSGIAAGAAAGGSAALAAYLFDPRKGGRRRAVLRDRFARFSRLARTGSRSAARDAAHRAQGALAEARATVMTQRVDDVVLVERVRSAIGRVARYPGAIEVAAQDGRITLAGAVLKSNAAAVRAAVRRVRGVAELDDQLQEHGNAGDAPGLHGPGRTIETDVDFGQRTLPPTTRILAMAGGGALVVYGLVRRGVRGTLLTGIGAGMALRGATNMELARAVGLRGGRRVDVQKSIVVGGPVSDAFAIWSRFAEFPRFMGHVRSVEPNPDGTYRWHVAGPAGAPILFDAEVTELIPNETIAWRSVEGELIRHSGIVQFAEADGATRISVRMSYNPPAGVIGHAVNALFGTEPKTALDEDLLRFKSLLETGTTSAGATEARVDEIVAAPPSTVEAGPDAAISEPLGAREPGDAWTASDMQGVMPVDAELEPPLDPGAPDTAPELTEPAYVESFTTTADVAVADPIAGATAMDSAMAMEVDAGEPPTTAVTPTGDAPDR